MLHSGFTGLWLIMGIFLGASAQYRKAGANNKSYCSGFVTCGML